MTRNQPFSYEACSDDLKRAVENVLTLARNITAYSGTGFYTASDMSAAWDVRTGLEYLVAPIEIKTVIQTKDEYRRHEST